MHILAVSDKIEKLLYDYFDRDRWRDIDCIISCGDLNQKYLSFLVTMIPAPLLYVPGNHDVTYKKNPPEGCDPIDGRVIKIKNTVIAGLGGSIWYNGHDFQYTEKQMRQKVKKIIRQSKKFGRLDIFVTHAPPKGIHDLTDVCHSGFESYLYLLEKLHPKILIHGHNHEVYKKNDRETVIDGTRIINTFGHYVFDL